MQLPRFRDPVAAMTPSSSVAVAFPTSAAVLLRTHWTGCTTLHSTFCWHHGSITSCVPDGLPRQQSMTITCMATSPNVAAKVVKKGVQPKYTKAARRFYNEKFREPQRLGKALAAAGVASRRASEELIFGGRVTVNGIVCKLPQTPVDAVKDVIYVDGRSLPKKMAPKMYFALNKPKGYICSSDVGGPKPVLSLFDEYFKIWAQRNPGLPRPRLFTAGRLDVGTSGLLLVTNDGEFAHKVSHPSTGLTKEYLVTVNSKVTRRQLQVLAEGTIVQGAWCTPVSVAFVVGDSGQRLRIVVSEGRNHEVRHLVENAGLEVSSLKRIRVGGLRLSRKLGVGKFDELTEVQANKLLDKSVQAHASELV